MSDIRTIKQIKDNIQLMVNNSMLIEAKELIKEYEKIVENDVEIYSMKAVIGIMEEKLDYAKSMLKAGIELESNNFDLNYNLAYVYEIEGKFRKSIKYYAHAYNKTLNKQLRDEIKAVVERMLYNVGRNESFDEILRQNIDKKKCLILCHFYSVFVKEFIENMKKHNDIEFDILTMDLSYTKDKGSSLINSVYIYSNINELTDKLNSAKKYDIIHIHFLDVIYSSVSQNIKEKCNQLIVSIWGSDYYRMSYENRMIQKRVLDNSDVITMANENTINEFDEYHEFKYSSKLKVCRFGLTLLEYINVCSNKDLAQIKKELGVPADSIVVTCGYNASPAQNHLEILNSIIQVKDMLPENLFLIFPMTYGDAYYKEIVIKEISKAGLKYKVFDKFLSNEDVAKLRAVSNIMVQVQTTDQLSGSMQEYLYCNNIVITGEWLPYEVFEQEGVHLLKVTALKDVGYKIVYAINNLNEIKGTIKNNKKIVWDLSSWERVLGQWNDVYYSRVTGACKRM